MLLLSGLRLPRSALAADRGYPAAYGWREQLQLPLFDVSIGRPGRFYAANFAASRMGLRCSSGDVLWSYFWTPRHRLLGWVLVFVAVLGGGDGYPYFAFLPLSAPGFFGASARGVWVFSACPPCWPGTWLSWCRSLSLCFWFRRAARPCRASIFVRRPRLASRVSRALAFLLPVPPRRGPLSVLACFRALSLILLLRWPLRCFRRACCWWCFFALVVLVCPPPRVSAACVGLLSAFRLPALSRSCLGSSRAGSSCGCLARVYPHKQLLCSCSLNTFACVWTFTSTWRRKLGTYCINRVRIALLHIILLDSDSDWVGD